MRYLTKKHRYTDTHMCLRKQAVSLSQRFYTVITNQAQHQKTTKIGSRGKEEERKIVALMLMHLLLQLRFHTLCYSKTHSLVTSKDTEVEIKAPICLPQAFKQAFENTWLPALCQMVLTNAECHSPAQSIRMNTFSVSSTFCCQLVIHQLLHNNKQTMAGWINISFYYSNCNH